jgi:ribosomal-protein-alanine N-acetyltransferase
MSDAPQGGIAPRIETERLILREFDDGDVGDVAFFTDPDVMRFIPRGAWKRGEVESIFPRMVARRSDEWRNTGYGMWAVVLKSSAAVIGHCGLQRLEDSDEIEVYYLLDKPHWNQGIATEATLAALRFADELGLKNIVAVAMPENGASQRVMQKAGMTHVDRAHHYGLDLVKYELRSTREAKAESARGDGNPKV